MIEDLLDNQDVEASGPWDTQERAEIAVDRVQNGEDVTVISSGDPQIYGMAAPILEAASDQDIEVRVFPGITALTAVASRLGSPITADFAAISLSDHLIPWNKIEQRIHAAGKGDFVLCIYNPRSEHRPDKLSRTLELLQQYRTGDTPTAIVRNAYRDGEEITRCTLETLADEDVDMLCTVIIGNSTTYYDGDRMISPRDYGPKTDA